MVSRSQSKLIRGLKARKHREAADAFLVEGVRLMEEVLESDAIVELVVTSPSLGSTPRGERLLNEISRRGWPRADAGESEFGKLSATETPQGVLAVIRRQPARLADLRPEDAKAVLALDTVSDPGNLGTLIRTAHALGIDAVFALPGCVDPWNPKAVRASAGSILRLPVSQEPWPEVAAWLQEGGFTIFCADPRGDPVPRYGPGPHKFALVVGSEPTGLSEDVRNDCQHTVAVPLVPGVDSLNVAVAGALLLDRLLAAGKVTNRSPDA